MAVERLSWDATQLCPKSTCRRLRESGRFCAALGISNQRGRRIKKTKTLNVTFGAWNVRTLLDRNDSLCPERKTAVVARELRRYNIDIAALSETRLADEGFAVRTPLARKLEECPRYISDRIIILRLHLENNNYINIISVYAPTMDRDDSIKNQFYQELGNCIDGIRHREQILLLGDFNARVGRDFVAWPRVLGRHGIGNMNSNG
ncbi:unnamed protein product [Euphydryas editha]|uniref:Endonuclease/exonuclease/phosphatase domain-containing protein n=1 Tax=Euphydryas editha TaxID=104508 RepID=A0AAU9UVH0_EUPED|nr:unnamed protein product [Euphydryas editha]